MIITVRRDLLIADATLGAMTVDGQFFGYTLEDPMRERLTADGYRWSSDCKIAGNTAIPAGRYEVTLSFSARFNELLPILSNVPDFSAIRIHGGNTSADTEGCILLGRKRDISARRISDCAAVVSALTQRIATAIQRGKVYIEVVNP